MAAGPRITRDLVWNVQASWSWKVEQGPSVSSVTRINLFSTARQVDAGGETRNLDLSGLMFPSAVSRVEVLCWNKPLWLFFTPRLEWDIILLEWLLLEQDRR